MPNKNARKGHNLERSIILDLKDIGYSWAKSSRSSSRRLDNCKIDINDVPFNIQAKATQMRPNYQQLYEECIKNINEQFPPVDAKSLISQPYIIVHKDTTRRAGKNKPHVQTITVDYAFGLKLLELYAKELENE